MSSSIPHSAYVEHFDPELAHHRAWLLAVLERLVTHDPQALEECGTLRRLWTEYQESASGAGTQTSQTDQSLSGSQPSDSATPTHRRHPGRSGRRHAPGEGVRGLPAQCLPRCRDRARALDDRLKHDRLLPRHSGEGRQHDQQGTGRCLARRASEARLGPAQVSGRWIMKSAQVLPSQGGRIVET
jgi:hypothetical protein